MASCNTCSRTILFGGKKHGELRFCGDACLQQGQVLIQAQELPEDVVMEAAMEVHRGLCPACGGSGPVDVHTSHEVWSLLFLTQWKSLPRISCRSCGVRKQVGAFLFSFIAGWWGVPWSLLVTPAQLIRNLAGLVSPPDPSQPSKELRSQMRMVIAEQILLDEQEKLEAGA